MEHRTGTSITLTCPRTSCRRAPRASCHQVCQTVCHSVGSSQVRHPARRSPASWSCCQHRSCELAVLSGKKDAVHCPIVPSCLACSVESRHLTRQFAGKTRQSIFQACNPPDHCHPFLQQCRMLWGHRCSLSSPSPGPKRQCRPFLCMHRLLTMVWSLLL